MYTLGIIEEDAYARDAIRRSLEDTGNVSVLFDGGNGEEALGRCLAEPESTEVVLLLGIHLSGKLSGVETAVELRRHRPHLPIIFYTAARDPHCLQPFLRANIHTHIAFVRKDHYWPPARLMPIIEDVTKGWCFIEPEIASLLEEAELLERLSAVQHLDTEERQVVALLAEGLTNAQIAERLGLSDPRTVSRINGQIYAHWGLAETTTDEKVARVRASLIYRAGIPLKWDEQGTAYRPISCGSWVACEALPPRRVAPENAARACKKSDTQRGCSSDAHARKVKV